MPAGIGIGTVGALLWTIAGAAMTAALVNGEIFAESAIGYGALIILITAAFLSAKVSYHKVKHRRAMVMGISGIAYYLCLLAINALFFGGQYAGMGVTAGAILAGSLCALLLGTGERKSRSHRQYKIRK